MISIKQTFCVNNVKKKCELYRIVLDFLHHIFASVIYISLLFFWCNVCLLSRLKHLKPPFSFLCFFMNPKMQRLHLTLINIYCSSSLNFNFQVGIEPQPAVNTCTWVGPVFLHGWSSYIAWKCLLSLWHGSWLAFGVWTRISWSYNKITYCCAYK